MRRPFAAQLDGALTKLGVAPRSLHDILLQYADTLADAEDEDADDDEVDDKAAVTAEKQSRLRRVERVRAVASVFATKSET